MIQLAVIPAETHTVRYLCGGELLPTHLAERRNWNEWDPAVCEGKAERVQEEAEHLLAMHEVPPQASAQERELDEIMQEAKTVQLPSQARQTMPVGVKHDSFAAQCAVGAAEKGGGIW